MANELNGKRIAALEDAGATVAVVSLESGKLDDIPAFNREIMKLFAEGRSAARRHAAA